MKLAPATHDLRVGRRVGVGAFDFLKVVDVLDLRVRAEPVVIAAEVRLPVRKEDGLVLGPTESRYGEVPPLGEEERREEHDNRDGDVALEPPVVDQPPDCAVIGEAKPGQRDGLGLGVALGLAVVDTGGTVAVGI